MRRDTSVKTMLLAKPLCKLVDLKYYYVRYKLVCQFNSITTTVQEILSRFFSILGFYSSYSEENITDIESTYISISGKILMKESSQKTGVGMCKITRTTYCSTIYYITLNYGADASRMSYPAKQLVECAKPMNLKTTLSRNMMNF